MWQDLNMIAIPPFPCPGSRGSPRPFQCSSVQTREPPQLLSAAVDGAGAAAEPRQRVWEEQTEGTGGDSAACTPSEG